MVAPKPDTFLEKRGEVSSVHRPSPTNIVAPGFTLSLVVPDGKGVFSLQSKCNLILMLCILTIPLQSGQNPSIIPFFF